MSDWYWCECKKPHPGPCPGQVAKVVKFPKRCEHGVPARLVKKLSGAWWYESQCEKCNNEKEM